MNIPQLENIEINNINNNNNTKQILNDLSLYLKNRHNITDNFNTNDYSQKMIIPSEWYINSFVNALEKMNDKYKKKEYEKFFMEFKKNIEKSIQEYDFDSMGQISDSLHFIREHKDEYMEIQKIFEEINLNNQIVEFINTEIIEIEINFKYNEKEKIFQINKKTNNFNENNLISNDTKKICYNILEFIQNFPDLIFTQKYNNTSIFNIEKEINIGECLNSYFNILKENITKNFGEEINEDVLNKIKKYIFEKIYSKTFPKYIESDDQNISIKIDSLSWVKPENLNLNNFDFESIIPIITDFFKRINKQHSPDGKLNIIIKIFEIIFNTLKYIKGELFSKEDLLNICLFIIIKSKPEKLSSNIKYLYIFENKDILDRNIIYLKELKKTIENISKLNYKSFKGISESEFNNKCKLVENN